jgi:predicted methyltransferase
MNLAWLAAIASALVTGPAVAQNTADPSQKAAQILDATQVQGGLIVHLGCGDGQVTAALRAADVKALYASLRPGRVGVLIPLALDSDHAPILMKVAQHVLARADATGIRRPVIGVGSAVRDLDAVLLILFYHDTVWMGVDRAHMNAAIFRALKPGGVYGIIDHSARAGARMDDVKTLHRIEEHVVRDEVDAMVARIAEDHIAVDYAGTSAQSSFGINCPLCYTDAYSASHKPSFCSVFSAARLASSSLPVQWVYLNCFPDW